MLDLLLAKELQHMHMDAGPRLTNLTLKRAASVCLRPERAAACIASYGLRGSRGEV